MEGNMHFKLFAYVAGGLVVLLVEVALAGRSDAAAAHQALAAPLGTGRAAVNAPACGPDWTVVPSPNQGSGHNSLFGVAVASPNDVWAVGYYTSDTGGNNTLIEHWDGSAWSIVPSPNQGVDNVLYGAAVVSSSDVWAVGYSGSNSGYDTLVEHWDGSTWSIVSSQSSGRNVLTAVAVVSANDVWAVGSYVAPFQTLVEHWDGSTWSIVPSPNQGTDYNQLLGVAVVSSDDVWAVGYAGNPSNPLIERWDGTQWNIVPSASQGSPAALNAVGAVSSDDVWAVGESITQTLVEQWNGSAWSIVPSPNEAGYLNGIAVASADDVWAVGGHQQTLVEHWNGSVWSTVASPSPGYPINVLNAVAVVSSDDVWAVGDYYSYPSGGVYQTLVERYNPCTGSPTPTVTGTPPTNTPTITPTPTPTLTTTAMPTVTSIPATPSATPSSTSPTPANTTIPTSTGTAIAPTITPTATETPLPPTDTPLPPTETATPLSPSETPRAPTATGTPPSPSPTGIAATPTACAIQFSDVPQGSTFYPCIHCLACLGIINGYSDGTFKPNNQVTRGQLSKIVANSAGFHDDQTTQMFEDVLVGSTFFQFIGRLAWRGYISGYPCGGPGEPCQPSNLPYFRPNNNATRGQISKIVSNAAGLADPPYGQQFEDVGVGSTFYTYTYRLVSRGVMSGYPCGGAGEPCVPPGNLPYFGPNNNATRGQTSKIVGNTFFPDCSPPAAR
jgi:hypothetical protein